MNALHWPPLCKKNPTLFNHNFEHNIDILSGLNMRHMRTRYVGHQHTQASHGDRQIYQRPVFPSNNRVCRVCNSGQVEDETHLIVQCTAFYESRKRLLQEMKLGNFNGSEEQLFMKITSSTKEEDFKVLGQYILECFRKSRMNSNHREDQRMPLKPYPVTQNG